MPGLHTMPPAAPADLQFQPTLFGRSEGQARVNAMTSHGSGLIAVGVEYRHHLPTGGPTPAHEGRVWLSADGSTQEDVTPHGLFGNVVLHTLIRRADESLVAFGNASSLNQNGDLETDGFGAWESSDRRTWTATTSGLPEDRWIHGTAQGNKGILAHVSMARAEFGSNYGSPSTGAHGRWCVGSPTASSEWMLATKGSWSPAGWVHTESPACRSPSHRQTAANGSSRRLLRRR